MQERVLFVDDEPSLISGLRRMLRPMKDAWEMEFLPSGTEAIEKVRGCCYDVVVTDMRMPHLTGPELLIQVKEACPNSVRIILSGQAGLEMILEGLPTAHQYLSKPCDGTHLMEIIERACSTRNIIENLPLREYISGCMHLPCRPETISTLRTIDWADEKETARIISLSLTDPGFAHELLRLVNSSFFGKAFHTTRAEDAVKMLGLDLLSQLFSGGFIAAKQINNAGQALYDADQAHIGSLMLASFDESLYEQVIREGKASCLALSERERRYFSSTYIEVEHYLRALWGIPEDEE